MSHNYSPGITAIIPSCRPDRAAGTIASLLSQTLTPSRIVLVADGEPFLPVDPRFEVIQNTRRMGKAASINLTAKSVETKLTLIIDDDTYLAPNGLERLSACVTDEARVVVPTLYPSRRVSWIERERDVWYKQAQRGFYVQLGLIGCCILVDTRTLVSHPVPENSMVEDQAWAKDLYNAGTMVSRSGLAACFTEEPKSTRALFRQLTRWKYGFLQMRSAHHKAWFVVPYLWLGGFGIASYIAVTSSPLTIFAWLAVLWITTLVAGTLGIGGGGPRTALVDLAAGFYAMIRLAVFRRPKW